MSEVIGLINRSFKYGDIYINNTKVTAANMKITNPHIILLCRINAYNEKQKKNSKRKTEDVLADRRTMKKKK
jgi:hypothetical protein